MRTPEPEDGPVDEERSLRTELVELAAGLAAPLAAIGALALLLGVVLFFIFEDLRLFTYVLFGLGGGLILVAIGANPSAVREIARARQGRYGFNTAIMVAAFVALAAVGNVLADAYSARFDVTTGQLYTLSRGTVDTLKGLDEDVTIRAFLAPDQSSLDGQLKSQLDDLVATYERTSDHVRYDVVDYQVRPQIFRRYGLEGAPAVIAETADRFEEVDLGVAMNPFGQPTLMVREIDLTSAILVATGTRRKTVYHTIGHGERDFSDNQDLSAGYGIARRALEGDNFEVIALPLATQGQVPPDATVVVVAGPQDGFVAGEIDALDRYLRLGGKVIVLLDDPPPTRLVELLVRWGIMVAETGVAVDMVQYVDQAGPTTPVPILNPSSPITGQLSAVFLPTALMVRPITSPPSEAQDLAAFYTEFFQTILLELEPREGSGFTPPGDRIELVRLLATTPQSWLERSIGQDDPAFDEGVDVPGPLPLAMASIVRLSTAGEADERDQLDLALNGAAALVVIGDADFAANQHRGLNNADLFLNSINWLTDQEQLIDIPQKPSGARPLVLSPEAANFIKFSSPLLIPFLVLIAGSLVWWRRSRRR